MFCMSPLLVQSDQVISMTCPDKSVHFQISQCKGLTFLTASIKTKRLRAASALPPKRRHLQCTSHVCFGPKVDMGILVDHLIGACEQPAVVSAGMDRRVLAPINPNHTITALHLPLGPPEQRGCFWRQRRNGAVSPGRNRLNYNFYSPQCALNFTLHALDFRFQKFL